jgi:hypothetical protein
MQRTFNEGPVLNEFLGYFSPRTARKGKDALPRANRAFWVALNKGWGDVALALDPARGRVLVQPLRESVGSPLPPTEWVDIILAPRDGILRKYRAAGPSSQPCCLREVRKPGGRVSVWRHPAEGRATAAPQPLRLYRRIWEGGPLHPV